MRWFEWLLQYWRPRTPLPNEARAETRWDGLFWAPLAGDALAISTHHHYNLSSILHAYENEPLTVSTAFQPTLQGLSAELAPSRRGAWTNYGDALVATWEALLEARGFPGYDAFLDRWWNWWERYEGHRGGAVEITLKNLARGLRGRDAATLVGDSGALPRVAAGVAVHVLRARAAAAVDVKALRAEEERMVSSVWQLTLVTHERPEALAAMEFAARVAFRLAFRERLLPSRAGPSRVDRPLFPSMVWRAAESVSATMGCRFVRKSVRLAERLVAQAVRAAPLGLSAAGIQSAANAEADAAALSLLGGLLGNETANTREPRGGFGKSGALSALLPAVLYLAAKYESAGLRAALTASALVGGNSAARGLLLGLWLGAEHGLEPALQEQVEELQGRDAAARIRAAALQIDAGWTMPACPDQLCWSTPSESVTRTAGVVVRARAAPEISGVKIVLVNENPFPVRPYGAMRLLAEGAGEARGRVQQIPASAEILPGETLAVDIALEPVALEAKPEVYVGLLELVRPVDAADRYAGNPVVIDGREGAHFTAKVGRFRA